ncbi:MAG: hypothetical protein ACUVSF_13285 [Anaerolineae bacterium]
MLNIAFDEILDKLPVAELERELVELLEPMGDLLPEKAFASCSSPDSA